MHAIITSTRNPRIINARKLSQRKHRQRQGRFALEGLQLLHMALDAGWQPVEVFFCTTLFAGTEAHQVFERFSHTEADLFPVSESVLHALSPSARNLSQGIVATFATRHASPNALHLTGSELVIILDRLQEPGNVGTLIRAADAVGAAAVIVIEPCVDVFDPRAVRSSMGSLFNIPLTHTTNVPELFNWLHQTGLRPVGADVHQGNAWDQTLWQGSVALILGNEARGLSEDVRCRLSHWACLPILGKADSLNVAVAGGVLMYTWLKTNQGLH